MGPLGSLPEEVGNGDRTNPRAGQVRMLSRLGVRACLRACVPASVHACVPASVRACIRACVRACIRACVRACIRACVCACVPASVRRACAIIDHIRNLDIHAMLSVSA